MKLFKVAILGTGTAAKEHVKGWLLAGAKILATAGPQPPRGELRQLIPEVPHFPELGNRLSKGIDAVDVCTPHHLHLQQMHEMCDWPVSILVEKPLVTRAKDLESLRTVLDQSRYPIVMRTNKRFEEHVLRFLDFVRKTTCPLAVQINWHQRPQYMARRRWYRCRSVSRSQRSRSSFSPWRFKDHNSKNGKTRHDSLFPHRNVSEILPEDVG